MVEIFRVVPKYEENLTGIHRVMKATLWKTL